MVRSLYKRIAGKDALIVIPRKEYEQMKARMFPVVYLKGKKAIMLDKRVGNALREYRRGNTKKIKSLADIS